MNTPFFISASCAAADGRRRARDLRHVQREQVRAAVHVVGRQERQAVDASGGAQRRIGADDDHADRRGLARQRAADAPHAEDSQGLPFELHPLREASSCPKRPTSSRHPHDRSAVRART